jgi:hypothetical protein
VAPRLIGTAWDSLRTTWTSMAAAFSDGHVLEGLGGIVQLLLLVLPLAGIIYLFWMLGARFVRGWRATKGRPAARSLLSVTGIAFLVFVALAWRPAPDRYTPIRPDEQWTLPAVAAAAAGVPTGEANLGTIARDPVAGTGGDTAVTAGTSLAPSPSLVSPTPSTSPTPSPSPSPSPSVSPSSTTSVTPAPSPSGSVIP